MAVKKSAMEADHQSNRQKDSKKGVYTKKLSKILEANDNKKGKKIQNYVQQY